MPININWFVLGLVYLLPKLASAHPDLYEKLQSHGVEQHAVAFIMQLDTCKDELLLRPGTKSWVRNFESEVLTHLGSGGEGQVYLVECDGKLACLKIFDRRQDFRIHRSLYKALQPLLPLMQAEEERSKSFLLDFTEGVPVYFIEQFGDRLGLELSERQRVGEQWLGWTKKLEKWAVEQGVPEAEKVGYFQNPQNSLYSFRTQEFKLIDAR